MNIEYENSSNQSNNIPADIDEVIREVTPVAWLDNPLPRPQHVVTDNYSPTIFLKLRKMPLSEK